MTCKAVLFACAVVAAGIGCRSDRTERENAPFSRPVESTDTTRTNAAGSTIHNTETTAPSPTPASPEMGAGDGAGAVPRTPSDYDDENADTSGTTGGATMTRNKALSTSHGASTHSGMSDGQSSGLNTTASGNGTTTNTGTNTENAGQGGTDDPTK